MKTQVSSSYWMILNDLDTDQFLQMSQITFFNAIENRYCDQAALIEHATLLIRYSHISDNNISCMN